MKQCSLCKQEKPIDEFAKDKGTRDGHDTRCKECRNRFARKLRQTEAHRAYVKAYNQEYWHSERGKAASLKWRTSERGKAHDKEWSRRKCHLEWYKKYHRLYARQWRDANPERSREVSKRYAHSEKGRESGRIRVERRRATKLSVPNRLTQQEWTDILNRYGHRCAYCGQYFDKLEQEHVIPLCKGGTHTKDNVVPACRHCNAVKFDKIVEYPQP